MSFIVRLIKLISYGSQAFPTTVGIFVRHSALAEVKRADLKDRKQRQEVWMCRVIFIHESWKIET